MWFNCFIFVAFIRTIIQAHLFAEINSTAEFWDCIQQARLSNELNKALIVSELSNTFKTHIYHYR